MSAAPGGATRGPSAMACPGPVQTMRVAVPVQRLGAGKAAPVAASRAAETAASAPSKGATEVMASGVSSDSVTAPWRTGRSPAQGVFATSLATEPPSLGVEGDGVRHAAPGPP